MKLLCMSLYRTIFSFYPKRLAFQDAGKGDIYAEAEKEIATEKESPGRREVMEAVDQYRERRQEVIATMERYTSKDPQVQAEIKAKFGFDDDQLNQLADRAKQILKEIENTMDPDVLNATLNHLQPKDLAGYHDKIDEILRNYKLEIPKTFKEELREAIGAEQTPEQKEAARNVLKAYTEERAEALATLNEIMKNNPPHSEIHKLAQIQRGLIESQTTDPKYLQEQRAYASNIEDNLTTLQNILSQSFDTHRVMPEIADLMDVRKEVAKYNQDYQDHASKITNLIFNFRDNSFPKILANLQNLSREFHDTFHELSLEKAQKLGLNGMRAFIAQMENFMEVKKGSILQEAYNALNLKRGIEGKVNFATAIGLSSGDPKALVAEVQKQLNQSDPNWDVSKIEPGSVLKIASNGITYRIEKTPKDFTVDIENANPDTREKYAAIDRYIQNKERKSA